MGGIKVIQGGNSFFYLHIYHLGERCPLISHGYLERDVGSNLTTMKVPSNPQSNSNIALMTASWA